MRTCKYYFPILLFFTVSVVFSQTKKDLPKHVIVIGFDGLSPDGLAHADTPTFDAMMREGSYTMHQRAVLPSSSATNWASMIMGAGPEQHGITSNSWERDNFTLPAVVQGDAFLFPTIFKHIDRQLPNAEIGAIYHWDGFGRLFEKSAVDYDRSPGTEDETADLAVKYIKDKLPAFTFIHFDHVDHAGHSFGHETPEYYASVAKSDTLLKKVWEAVTSSEMAGETLIIVTSDHGGIGKGHGGESLKEIEIPFIMWGKSIKPGHKLRYPVYQYDNAATVAYALGFELPRASIGKPVIEAFIGNDINDPYPILEQQKAPLILPKAVFSKPAGGLFNEVAEVVLKNQEDSGILRYTTNGSMPDPDSRVYSAPFNLSTNTVVRAALFQNGKMISPVQDAYFRIKQKDLEPPVEFKLYYLKNLKQLPNFTSLSPDASGTLFEITSDELDVPVKNHTAVLFTTRLQISQAGEYTFFIRSDDGSKLYVEGKEIIDNDGDHGIIEKSGSVFLSPGTYPLKVEWFNGGGDGWLDVYYASEKLPKQILPATVLIR